MTAAAIEDTAVGDDAIIPRVGLWTDDETLVLRRALKLGGNDAVCAMLPERRHRPRSAPPMGETLNEIASLARQYNVAQRAWIVAFHSNGLQTLGDLLTVLRLYHSQRNCWQPASAERRTEAEQRMYDAAMYHDMPKVLLGYVEPPPVPSATPESAAEAQDEDDVDLTNEQVAALDKTERAERREKRTIRTCMCCRRRKFASDGPGHRICRRCKSNEAASVDAI